MNMKDFEPLFTVTQKVWFLLLLHNCSLIFIVRTFKNEIVHACMIARLHTHLIQCTLDMFVAHKINIFALSELRSCSVYYNLKGRLIRKFFKIHPI